jgi:hypothetical protein
MKINLNKDRKMIKKKLTNTTGFMNTLVKHAETVLPELQRVAIAKKKYLLENSDDILQAVKEGYGYGIIAKAATIDLLKKGVPAEVSFIKEGEEITRETQYFGKDIKELCEANQA